MRPAIVFGIVTGDALIYVFIYLFIHFLMYLFMYVFMYLFTYKHVSDRKCISQTETVKRI